MKIVTLNIQGGYQLDQLAREIKEKISPFDLLCLQEVCQSKTIVNQAQQVANFLGKNYISISFLPIDFRSKTMGNAIIYNRNRLSLIKQGGVVLPKPKFRLMMQKIAHYYTLDIVRVGLIGQFQNRQYQNISIANIHLSPVGGYLIRKRQIELVIKKLDNNNAKLILGDFNTIRLFKRNTPERNLLEKNHFQEASINIDWTASPNHPDPNWKRSYFFYQMLKPFHRLFRQKTDYIFATEEITTVNCKTVDFDSSDHRAVVLEFNLKHVV